MTFLNTSIFKGKCAHIQFAANIIAILLLLALYRYDKCTLFTTQLMKAYALMDIHCTHKCFSVISTWQFHGWQLRTRTTEEVVVRPRFSQSWGGYHGMPFLQEREADQDGNDDGDYVITETASHRSGGRGNEHYSHYRGGHAGMIQQQPYPAGLTWRQP